nr:carboxypeptidase N subunit 2-like isoform X2 [Leptinotarsa decemlineata]
MQLLFQILVFSITPFVVRGSCESQYLPNRFSVTCTNFTFRNVSIEPTYNELKWNYTKSITINESAVPVFKSDLSFTKLINFSVAVFSDIGINVIEQHAFSKMPNLTNLFLSNNNINRISIGIFDNLKKLKKLDLSNNSISVIEADSFLNSSITLLNISLNHLTFSEGFSSMTKLTVLDFSQNNLSSFDLSQTPDKLKTLILGNNNVKKFTGSRNKMLTISTLILTKNSIQNLEPLPLKNFNNLAKLYLNRNDISSLPTGYFSDLLSLCHLDLSYNKLTVIPTGTFDTLGHLQTLILSHNNIKIIEETNLHNLYDLSQLYIDHNRLITLNLNALMKPDKHLKNVWLDSNRFSCEFLSQLIEKTILSNIEVANGENFNSSNVNGCQ